MKMNKALEDRNSNIDLVKGIGIILLIIGHISDGNLQKVIYSFHMPLFVVISGFLFTYPLDKRGFIIQRAKSLLYPYVSFNLILLLIGVIHYVTGFPVWFFGNSRSAVAAVLSFVCGKGISVTWFLSFLFLIQVLECFLNTKKIAIVALSFVGCVGGVRLHTDERIYVI